MFYVMKESDDGVMTTVGVTESQDGVNFLSDFYEDVMVIEHSKKDPDPPAVARERFPRVGVGVHRPLPKTDEPDTVPVSYEDDTVQIDVEGELADLLDECRRVD